jgi:prophage regulatory protein
VTDSEIMDSKGLEAMTGTRASTWRYWAGIGEGPASFKLGRRRVWRRSTVEAWLADQEAAGQA